MSEHLENAQKELKLASLLADRVGIRNEECREQIRERLHIARAEMTMAENSLATFEKMKGLNEIDDDE